MSDQQVDLQERVEKRIKLGCKLPHVHRHASGYASCGMCSSAMADFDLLQCLLTEVQALRVELNRTIGYWNESVASGEAWRQKSERENVRAQAAEAEVQKLREERDREEERWE